MPADKGLFGCLDPAIWRGVYGKYWTVMATKASGKGRSAGKLLNLDKWYQEELPALISGRPLRYLVHAELVKLMEWKLARGRFRPGLQRLVVSNSEEEVESCTKHAFDLLPDVEAAIAKLSMLKGIGPATASVLAAGAGDEVAFMADECVESIPELCPVQYTAKHFSRYLQHITAKTQHLNEVDSQKDWTPHRVELCLWTWAAANQLQPSLMEEFIVLGQPETSGQPVKKVTPRANKTNSEMSNEKTVKRRKMQ
ncbi:uncharacterized protein LOC114784724 isoform X2 [Denticeps clupeoides]|uniref:uncharacterized protein LOC114784724 isoform X2 n=1 Tax=Denticeps clupeoides TaxID=299321 RepID=UPI0010A59887|nr:uncharacterized protein LOC114784724 isoform X2 [Denticeps clupeoides]